MTRKCVLATCQLNQWVLDYDGNRDRIIEAIKTVKAANATLILTPELCIPGYGLLDHWLENDVYAHSWDIAAEIIACPDCQDIIIDLGLPIQHRGCNYNARLIALNGEVLAIRPKLDLCNDGNFREMRYFTPWPRGRFEEYALPEVVQALPRQQKRCPIGECAIEALDGSFASETCEELWTPNSPHASYSLAGIEIVLNSSGSHHELRKLDARINLIKEATAKTGGVYLYSNQRGCDGDRLYYDGCALIMSNGEVLAQGSQFSLRDVEVQTAIVDLDSIWAHRTSRSRGMQANEPSVQKLKRIPVNFQSRSRMVLAYALGQLIPHSRGGAGGLLILGSANVDECLRGYLTKYDCSSADINPIGGISKTDLKRFIKWAETAFELPVLQQFLDATPTAELEPITHDYVQSDEADMGFTYGELSILGRLRKTFKLGTVGLFQHLVAEWSERMKPRDVYQKVRDFMYYYAVNRHKMTTMTPGLYLESYTPDDNRFDLRPFLYPRFTFEHRKIEGMLKTMEEGEAGVNGA
ncbi:glutamine-dependent NAD(+) synthetase [Friedmanniomyces endolithicus]|nr:glutamine-dependent NAD(+) synthetase [Friedmanniomyces endolithicus]